MLHSRDGKPKVSASPPPTLHLRGGIGDLTLGGHRPSTVAFFCSPECNMCKRLFFSGFSGHIPQGDEPFSQQPEGGQNSRLLDSFQFNWPPGWPRQHLVKLQASIIPWFICNNIHKHRANEAVGTRSEWAFAANETWIVTSAGEVQPELCTHQIWDLRLEVR